MTSQPSDARDEIAHALGACSPLPLTRGKRRLMQSVLAILVRNGDAGLSMRAIAKEADLQPASIYSHFRGGKDELVSETILSSYIDFLALVIANTDGKASARDQFEHVASAHIDFQLSYGLASLWELTLDAERAISHLTEEARLALGEFRRLYRNYVVALIAQMGGDVDAASKGAIVINLLDRIVPRSLNEFPDLGTMKDMIVGACLGVIQSKRVPAPKITPRDSATKESQLLPRTSSKAKAKP
ncbi:AcrR family transcriptional regulator [Arthrobacter sp. 754]